MSGSLAILGASGHGKVVADTAIVSGWKRVVFFDDVAERRREFWGQPVLGDTSALIARVNQFAGVVVAIGNNHRRLHKLRELIEAGAEVVSVIHPSAYIGCDVTVGFGSVVFANSVIQPGSSVGNGVIVNTGATVDHDCVLEDGVHVSPGAHLAGCVSVGQCAWLGIGCAVRQGLTIGFDSVVGAGAVVITDVACGSTVVGNPARPKERA